MPNASHNFNSCEVIEVLQNTLMLLIILVLALALSFVIKDTVGQIASVLPPLLDNKECRYPTKGQSQDHKQLKLPNPTTTILDFVFGLNIFVFFLLEKIKL